MNIHWRLGTAIHTSSTCDAEAGGFQILVQLELNSITLLPKRKKNMYRIGYCFLLLTSEPSGDDNQNSSSSFPQNKSSLRLVADYSHSS